MDDREDPNPLDGRKGLIDALLEDKHDLGNALHAAECEITALRTALRRSNLRYR